MWSLVAPGSLLTSMPNCKGIPRFSHKTNYSIAKHSPWFSQVIIASTLATRFL